VVTVEVLCLDIEVLFGFQRIAVVVVGWIERELVLVEMGFVFLVQTQRERERERERKEEDTREKI